METILGIAFSVIIVICILIAFIELRIRQPDVLVLYEAKGQIGIRKGKLYPRHLSLPLKRTTTPLQLTVEASAVGNLGVNIKLVGSVALSVKYIQALIRVGGWNTQAVAHAVDEVGILLQGLIKEYTEKSDISALSSLGLLNYLTDRFPQIEEKFGIELISLAVQTLEPTDPEIGDALRQQEQARLLEQTERLNHQARVAAMKLKYKADEEIADMDHALEMKKAELKQILHEKDSALAQERVEDELAQNRLRLAFEKEELEVLRSSPELLMLTPQAARLAEASQGLKNARTVISLTPQEAASGSELLSLFNTLIQKALDAKKGA
jgi:hypothetical protein